MLEKLSWGDFFFFPASFPRLFLCSVLLLPLLPASSAPSTSASRGNGRFLGWRSKRRNCLRVQSSKNASSIWRGRVRWARRPLPRPPAAAAAATPASCRGDLEPRPAGVSSRARTRTLTLTHTDRHTRPPQPHAPARARPPRPATFRSGAPLLLPGSTSLVLCVLGCHCAGCVSVRRGAVWFSPRPPRWPQALALPSQEPAAPEVSHVAEVCFLFIKSCVYLLVWGGAGAEGGRRPAMPRKRQRVADGDARATGAGPSAPPAARAGAAAEEGRAGAGTEEPGLGGQRGAGGA